MGNSVESQKELKVKDVVVYMLGGSRIPKGIESNASQAFTPEELQVESQKELKVHGAIHTADYWC